MQNQLPDDIFLFGSSFAPYGRETDWPLEEWDRDLATMRELHFNTVRVFAPWDRIEIEEGIFDYHKQDHLFDLAAKHRLHVILNFGGVFGSLCGIYPPRYLLDSHRCQPRQASPGVPAVGATVQYALCPDDPLYREKAFQFMERTVARYADRDQLLAWMIWNEPASPFCYCPHTLARFRDWLRAKYDTLERLNEAWGTAFPVNFRSWEAIPAPSGSLIMQYDWERFNQWRLHSTMAEVTALTARLDPRRRPTTANLVYHLAALEGPVASPQYGLDVGRAGQSMTIMGVSCYTVEHRYDPGPGYLTAYKLSRLRSASQDDQRRMLVLETGAGPNIRQLTPDQRTQTFWHLLAHNVKSILLWNYRSRLSDGQVALFNLMRWDGSVSRRAAYVGEFSALLQRHARLLNHVYPERQAALLTLEEQQIQREALCGTYTGETYEEAHDSRVGAYKLLWDLQIPADCLAENNLDEMHQYRLLLLPMVENMTAEVAERLKRFVAQGGTVIAESPFAYRDSEGRLQCSAPAFGLEEVFGCRTCDRESRETAAPIQSAWGESRVYRFWQEYELRGGEAVAHYAQGEAAVVRHRYGQGTAIVAGTEVFRQYVRDPQPAMTAFLREAVLASGAEPVATLTGDSENVEVSRLSGEGGLLYLIQNHEDTERRLRVTLRDGDGPWHELQSGQALDLSQELTLAGNQVLALVPTSS